MDLHTPYLRVSFRMILSDLFNDSKNRAVSLRQLSFLFVVTQLLMVNELIIKANVGAI